MINIGESHVCVYTYRVTCGSPQARQYPSSSAVDNAERILVIRYRFSQMMCLTETDYQTDQREQTDHIHFVTKLFIEYCEK